MSIFSTCIKALATLYVLVFLLTGCTLPSTERKQECASCCGTIVGLTPQADCRTHCTTIAERYQEDAVWVRTQCNAILDDFRSTACETGICHPEKE